MTTIQYVDDTSATDKGQNQPFVSESKPLPVKVKSVGGDTLGTAVTITKGFKTVAATGTPELLAAASTLVSAVTIQGYKAQGVLNTGKVFVGTGIVDAVNPIELDPGISMSIVAPFGRKIDLHDISLDVATAGDGVGFMALA